MNKQIHIEHLRSVPTIQTIDISDYGRLIVPWLQADSLFFECNSQRPSELMNSCSVIDLNSVLLPCDLNESGKENNDHLF